MRSPQWPARSISRSWPCDRALAGSPEPYLNIREYSSWLDSSGDVCEAGVSIAEEEAATFVKSIDCYVLGSRTYERALQLDWPYGDTPTVFPPVAGSKMIAGGGLEIPFHGLAEQVMLVPVAGRPRASMTAPEG